MTGHIHKTTRFLKSDAAVIQNSKPCKSGGWDTGYDRTSDGPQMVA